MWDVGCCRPHLNPPRGGVNRRGKMRENKEGDFGESENKTTFGNEKFSINMIVCGDTNDGGNYYDNVRKYIW